MACGADPASRSGRLTVFAASSLTEVLPRLDGDARYEFSGSDDLALQLREGASADVFAAASPEYPTELHAAGIVDQPVVFATNTLVVIVPRDNPAGIHSVEDLGEPGVKLLIGARGVPVGDYARRLLDHLGAKSVLDNVVSEEEDVKAIVAKVRLGEADAGFVYATDVEPVANDVTEIELPARAQPTVEYMAAVVSNAEHERDARDFVGLLTSDRGESALTAAGFGIP